MCVPSLAIAILWKCANGRLGLLSLSPTPLNGSHSTWQVCLRFVYKATLFGLIRFLHRSQPLAVHVPVSVRTPHASGLAPEYLVQQTLYVLHRLAKHGAATKALDQLG